jgi:hypothetical protein
MVGVLVFHGPIALDLADQMRSIAEGATRWSVVHWMAAAALSLYALSGLVVLTSGSRLTEGWWTTTAWALLPVSALWTAGTAVAEATVVTDAAVSGARETFEAWWAFAAGRANGFAFFALAIAVIAGNEARTTARATPAWSAWIAIVAGVLSFAGWGLGMWFGVGLGNLLWVASSIVMSLWILWFGVALMRFRANVI